MAANVATGDIAAKSQTQPLSQSMLTVAFTYPVSLQTRSYAAQCINVLAHHYELLGKLADSRAAYRLGCFLLEVLAAQASDRAFLGQISGIEHERIRMLLQRCMQWYTDFDVRTTF